MNKALIVIDAQEDLTRGALRNEEAIQALPVIQNAVQQVEKNSTFLITYTADTHTKSYLNTQEGRNLPVPHCIVDTKGWLICEEVQTEDPENEYIITKSSFGSLDLEGFDEAEEIWLCGFCTDICVSANFQILKAMYPEIPIVVIEDACAGTTPEMHEAALKVMKSCQARIVKWEDLKKENAL